MIEAVIDFVRGIFCLVFKVLFEYGLKKSFFFGGVCYFWLFIEEVG